MTSPEALDHDAIAARVPHAGAMCLLDRVVSWDENQIECTARGCPPPGAPAHPLAHAGRLPATAAIEYAAQAMALHGRLVQESRRVAAGGRPAGKGIAPDRIAPDGLPPAPARGFLAALRSVRLFCRWLAPQEPVLTVRAARFAGDEVQVLYDFDVRATAPIAQGRAVVVLDAGARTPAMTAPVAAERAPPDDGRADGAGRPD